MAMSLIVCRKFQKRLIQNIDARLPRIGDSLIFAAKFETC
jgi:hypothetical protein